PFPIEKKANVSAIQKMYRRTFIVKTLAVVCSGRYRDECFLHSSIGISGLKANQKLIRHI
ncbi:hypothetical protein PZE06_29070, partial [Robertmurraya sp. DFI.2.37]|uniref:hypothetical protein n=1 Tax=Robertmurraya sp. DFI.2.37 TaxID=3031819 RepID=UPI0023D9E189